MKRLAYLLFASLLLGAGGAAAQSIQSWKSGSTTVQLNTLTGVLTVTGYGTMGNGEIGSGSIGGIGGQWSNFRMSVKSVEVKSGVCHVARASLLAMTARAIEKNTPPAPSSKNFYYLCPRVLNP